MIRIAIDDKTFEFHEDMEPRDIAFKARFLFRPKSSRTGIIGYIEVDYIAKVVSGYSNDAVMDDAIVKLSEILTDYMFKGVNLGWHTKDEVKEEEPEVINDFM